MPPEIDWRNMGPMPALGQDGWKFFSGAGSWDKASIGILVLEDATFTSIAGQNIECDSEMTVPAGMFIPGLITNAAWSAGKVIVLKYSPS